MAKRKSEIARMTWVEAKEASEQDPVVILPIGAMEAHGRQTPVGADWLVAQHVARAVVETTPALIAPVIPFGYSDSFIGFAGSISVRPATLTALIRDVLEQLIGQGFRRFLMLNSHAGNDSIIDQVGQELRRQYPSVLIGMMSPWQLAKDLTKDLFAGREAVMGHGAEPVASIMCAVTPDDMRMDLALQDKYSSYHGLATRRGGVAGTAGQFKMIHALKEVSKSGTLGDGRVANIETGSTILKRIVDFVGACVKDIQGMPIE